MTEYPSYFRYWGKTEKDTGAYHLLPYHCLDVAAVGWFLLAPEKPLSERLAKQIKVSNSWLRDWFVFCLCLHDIGKFATAFQSLVPDLSPLLILSNTRMPYSERHDSLGFALWQDVLSTDWLQDNELNLNNQRSDLSKLLRNIDPWMEVVTGHHGEPPKRIPIRRQNFFTIADEHAACNFLKDVTVLFLKDFDKSILADKILKNHFKLISWILAGIVVLADWLGSGRKPESYCHHEILLNEYWQDYALPFAEQVITKADFSHSSITSFAGTRYLFPFITSLTPLQDWAEKQQLGQTNQLFILEDVTGAGKTEAAMVIAHRLMESGLADGIYVALPTMATANSMYERLGKAYRKLFKDGVQPSLVLAHGARHLYEGFRQSVGLPEKAPAKQRYEDNEESTESYCSAWLADSRKKALLAEIGVGTLDQALLAVLPARHQSLRLLGLANKILIVDEVHSYDPYMNQLLQTLIKAHARQGGSVILLSATLPRHMREKYVRSFCEGIDVDMPTLDEMPGYPLATHVPSFDQQETTLATRSEIERMIKVTFIEDFSDVLKVIQETVERGQCACWVRNTVKDARTAYSMLSNQRWIDKSKLMLFHSRFTMVDRQRIEAETLELFDKNSTAKKRHGQVLIATQVVEQSLDLDFDVMITDLAPIDLLIQRAGRLHRHTRDSIGNPLKGKGDMEQRGEAYLYVFGPMPTETPAEDWLKSKLPGTQAVYQHVGQLWLTQQQVCRSGSICIPSDARTLIEGVYGEKGQELIPDSLLGLSWNAEGEAGSRRGMARLNALKLEKGYTRSSAEDSGGWDKETRIPTRLGIDTVTVALASLDGEWLKPYADVKEFGWELSMIDLPKTEWKKFENKISPVYSKIIEQLKDEIKLLKWVELLPVTDDIAPYYDPHMGWGLNKEEKDESYY
ncbi:MAG TPA: CRISPR-associated helicase Cas3' [Desulfobacteraceae bacterium]|nr:CRISPR-associated helicase Cas3' [Desulfobacteraceae bacterium]HPJ67869.1 CRISPR-associated helicase Cas3' [Desulfobacteraceae bacterium]HPQ28242.1 CRISPR-associated helicase Cas3' [Desulfobacteraceae bacterium]